jgi:hypothetical protein
LFFPVTMNNGAYTEADVSITATGNVNYTRGGSLVAGWLALDNVSFSTDQATFPTGPQGPPGSTISPPIVTALPVNGPDGELAVLRTSDMDTNGCAWQARRRALNGSWDFVGGAPYRLRGTSYQCVVTSAWETVSTAVMGRWTCPASGVYRFLYGCQLRQQVSGAIEAYMGLMLVPGTTPLDSLRTNLGATNGANILHFAYETQQTMTAGQVVAVGHNTQVAAANALYVGQWLYIEPARFS